MVKKLVPMSDYQKAILADPQTSGGLLVAVNPSSVEQCKKTFSGKMGWKSL
jgi:selenide,water dikinase